MSSAAFVLPDLGPADAGAGDRLSREAAALVRRLADLLDQALPDGGEHRAARQFLRTMADAASAAPLGPGAEPHPLDRLATGFGLSPAEVDLVLLAGLADEHEGYSGVLRTLHPRGEPRPTAGLAAQLLCASPAERRMLRGILEGGPAVRAGALRLDPD